MKSLENVLDYLLLKDNKNMDDKINILLNDDECHYTMVELAVHLINNNEELKKSLKEKRNDYEFRKKVKYYYDNQCIITGYDMEECSICHIKPFSECDTSDKYNYENGIILTNSLHTLFDKFLFTFNPITNEIIISDKIKNSRASISQFSNKQVYINPKSKPYLIWHYNNFMRKNELNF